MWNSDQEDDFASYENVGHSSEDVVSTQRWTEENGEIWSFLVKIIHDQQRLLDSPEFVVNLA